LGGRDEVLGGMADWVLTCKNCRKIFSHSRVSEETLFDYFLPLRPKIPPEGEKCECPNCGVKSTYNRTELTYRSERGNSA